MNWYHVLGMWEYVCISLFAGLYMAYLIKITYTARQLKSPMQPLMAKLLLRTLYFALLIIALLGPSYGGMNKEVKALGKDIYLLIDLSQSMNAVDIAPTRLERVKFEMTKLVKFLPSNRIGLIIFSSEAFIQCPLTFDQNTLLLFIETLKTSLLSGGGTNFEPALQIALQKHTDLTNTTSQNQAKIIVLFSDGEDFGDNNNRLLREIENSGIRLFTVGVGSDAGGKIPAGKGYKKDKEGTEIVTTLQKETLQRMAGKNENNYFELSDTQDDMPKLLQTIVNIEGNVIDKRKIEVIANKYYYFLLAALLLIGLDVLITTKTIQL